MSYTTSRGTSGTGRSECFGIYFNREYVGSCYTIDGGANWFIRGVWPENIRNFTSSQAAIEQATFLHNEWEKEQQAKEFALF
jgi:hypothetical protein